MRTLATVVKVIATMNEVIIMDQHTPEIKMILDGCSRFFQRLIPRIKVNPMERAMALKKLRQKVTSKLGAESRCRVTTPAILQSRVTKIINDTA